MMDGRREKVKGVRRLIEMARRGDGEKWERQREMLEGGEKVSH